MMSLRQAHEWIGSGQMLGNSDTQIKRVHTDTRSLQAGDLFVALNGDRFDGHHYLPQAKSEGAVAAIAQHGLVAADLSGIELAEPKLALGLLAAGWRSQFSLPLIAVTGSNGKTTVTQMLAAILRAYKQDAAFATEGNLNNDIGVPLTLLRLTKSHDIGVVELGMNHPGEIAYLSDLAKPTVALVNNAQREHLEFMVSVEAVAQENGSVIAALSTQGTAVFPAGDAYTPIWRRLAGDRKVMTFSLQDQADVTAQATWQANHWAVQAVTPVGSLAFTLHIAGKHNVKNALAATACALAAGVPLACIAEGLSGFEPVKGRSRVVTLVVKGRTITLVDDTYNANPDSMQAAIEVLAAMPGPRLLVMGEMGEVGDQGEKFHHESGVSAQTLGIENLFTLGQLSKHAASGFDGGRHFSEIEQLIAAVMKEVPHLGSLLVKGSRFMKMERVVQVLVDSASGSASGVASENLPTHPGACHAA